MDFSPGEDFLVSCTAAAHILGPKSFSPQGLPAEQAMFQWFRKKTSTTAVVKDPQPKPERSEKPVR